MTMHAAIVPLYALALAEPFAARDTFRTELTQIQIRRSQNQADKLILTATDGKQLIRVCCSVTHSGGTDLPATGIGISSEDARALLRGTQGHAAAIQAPPLPHYPTLLSQPDATGTATSVATVTLEMLVKSVKGCLKHAKRAHGRDVMAHWRAEAAGNHIYFALDTNIPGLEAAVLASGLHSEKAERNTPVVPTALELLKE